MMVISSASLAASSGRLPFSNCSMESFRCLIMVVNTCSFFFFIQVGAFVDSLVLQRGLHHAQGRQSQFFLFAHGINHVFLHTFGQGHGAIIG